MTDKNLISTKLKYTAEYGINFDKRIIHVFGELTEDIGTNLRVKYEIMKQWITHVEEKAIDELTLHIASYGGSIYAVTSTLDFYDEVFAEDKIKVNTKAEGVCMSAATILLCGGTGVRSSTNRTKFMLHDIQVEGMGGSAKQLQSAMANLNHEQIEMFSFYAQFANKDRTFTDKELRKEAAKWIKKYTKDNVEYYLTSKEMLDLKLIDMIS